MPPTENSPFRAGPRFWWPPIAVVLAFLVAEMLVRHFVPADQLERVLLLLDRDDELIWRLRADLDITFEGASVITGKARFRVADERAGRFDPATTTASARVVCLGASPTFGWGVHGGEAYPATLERRLKAWTFVPGANSGPAPSVEVINGGVPGYTSWQGVGYFRRDVLPWRPTAITVSYAINDFDRYRFFDNDGRPDSARTPRSPLTIAVQNLLNRSAAYRAARKAIIGVVVDRGAFDPTTMPRRVSVDEYKANLTAIDSLARDGGVDLVFLKMPINLPFDRLQVHDAKAAQALYGKARTDLAEGNRTGAIADLTQAIIEDPTHLDALHRLWELYVENGNDEAARRIRQDYIFAASFRDRPDLAYNRAMAEVAESTGLPLLDLVKIFEQDGRGMELWNSEADPFHPNAAGHKLIADALAKVLAPRLFPPAETAP
ncbi:hypothetical protein KDL45_05405 [bacterium]|nr:hypothetical protein [bacterium]